jgi:hypothetical protein
VISFAIDMKRGAPTLHLALTIHACHARFLV